MMQHFTYREGELHIEGCRLRDLAQHYGTPAYVYSRSALSEAYLQYANALGDHPGRICYAVKANSNIAVLQTLANLGAGFDIVSGGELARVLRAGGDPSGIIFSGVGKTREEMSEALQAGIACFNVESESELRLLNEVALGMGRKAPMSLRVNPDVDAQTHPYISTGLKENKFGVDIHRALDIYRQAASLAGIEIVGVDCHIGSQLTTLSPFYDALDRVLTLVDNLQKIGISLRHIDLGGGIGVDYQGEDIPSIAHYFEEIKNRLGSRELAIYMEPGRSIAANSGALLTQVQYLKESEHKNFAIVDAAMNDNIRPALYQAWQNVLPLKEAQSKEAKKPWDIVGPVCETGDFIGKDRQLALQEGDLLALMSSGAYGFVMSSNYNTRCRAPEILVGGTQHFLVRRRETLDDLIGLESLLPNPSNI